MKIPKIISKITFRQNPVNNLDAEYKRQQEVAIQKQKEEELRAQAEWEALIKRPQKYQKGEENGK